MENLIESSTEFIWQVDKNGVYTYVSGSAERLIGYKKSEIIGKTPFDFMESSEAERVGAIFSKIIQNTERINHLEDTMIHKNGHHVSFETNGIPLFDDNGVFNGYFGICRNITNQKKIQDSLKESEERFKKLSNLTFEGIIIHNNGIVIDINQSFVDMFGYSRDELIGKNIIPVLVPEKYQSLIKDNIIRNYAKPYEIKARRKDGTLLPVEIEAKDIKNNDEKFRVAAIRDISERRTAEIQLKESNQRLKEAERIGRIGHVDWDVERGEALWSDVMFDLYERDITLGTPTYDEIMNLHVTDDAKRLEKAVNRAINRKEPYDIDLKVNLPSGKKAVYRAIGKPVMDETGKITHIKGIVQDVTKIKKSIEKLQLSEENYRTIFNTSTDTIFVHDYTNGKIIDVNQTTIDTFGYSKDEFLNMDVGELSINEPPYTQKEAFEWIQKAAKEGEQTFKWLAKNKDGELIWFENSLQLVQLSGEKRVLVMGRNITNKKQMEDALKESEQKYRTYVDNAPIGIFIADKKGNYLEINEAASKITGYNKEQLLSMNVADILPEGEKEEGLKHFQTVVEKGFSQADVRYLHHNGSIRWWSVSAVKLSDDRYLGFTQDITHKKLAAEEILQSKKETEMILNTAADGIRIVDKEFNVISLNDTFSDMIQVSKDDALGQKCYDLFKSEYCGTEKCALNQVLNTGKGFEKEDFRICPNGSKIPCIIKVIPFKDKNDMICGIIEDYRDITNIVEKEKQLEKAHKELYNMNKELERKVEQRTNRINQLLKQKDEFINQLGHDLKNPLGPFMQLLPILKSHVTSDKDQHIIDVLDRNANYMRNLVKKTIDLAKLNSEKTQFSFNTVLLRDIVDEVVAVNQQLFSNQHITVENNVCSDCTVSADEFHIQELFTNLFTNAVKYTEGHGMITIDTKLVDEEVLVSVTDTGIGISAEHIDHLFDEYYKVDHSRHDFESSGLGLPICKRIVEKHGGKIWAESAGLGKGSIFYFTLPKVNNQQ